MNSTPNNQSPGGSRTGLMAVIIGSTALGSLSMNIFLPSVPGLQRAFSADYATVQLGLTLYLAALAVAQPIYGPLSDRFGRRPTLRAGLLLYIAGTAACLFAPTIEYFVAGRIVQAAGGCAGLVIGRAIVRDLYDREQAASMIAYVSMAMIVAPTFAPVLGGFLDAWVGWQGSFIFLMAFGLVVLAGSLFRLPETLLQRSEVSGIFGLLGEFRILLGMRDFCGYAFQVGFITGVFYAFLSGAPYLTIVLMKQTPIEYGLYYISISGAFMVAAFISARISTRIGIDRMVRWGMGISACGAVALAVADLFGQMTPLLLFAPMAVVAFGNGFSVPNGTAGAISVDLRRSGAAAGLLGALQMSIGTALSYLVSVLLVDRATPLAILMVAAAAAAWAAYLWGVRRS